MPQIRATELISVIEGPARRFVEAGGRVILDRDEPKRFVTETNYGNALPLLAYTLELAWLKMHYSGDGELRLDRSLDRAITLRGDAVLHERPDAQEQLRRLLTQKLARVEPVPADASVMPRRVLGSELSNDDWPLIYSLANARLVRVIGTAQSDNATVEVAHEFVFRHFEWLHQWFDEERKFVVWKFQIEKSLHFMQAQAPVQRDEALLKGLALYEALSWLQNRAYEINPSVRQFIELSRDAEQAK